MRAAPPVRATDSPIASAKKAFQADHQLLATRRQVAFHREQGAAGTAATPFVLVDEAIHAGVVVRIDREERRIDGSLFAQRFVVIDGMSRFELRDGLIADYRESVNGGVAMAQLGVAAPRIEKVLARWGRQLRDLPATQAWLAEGKQVR
jgi:hypothetical protein